MIKSFRPNDLNQTFHPSLKYLLAIDLLSSALNKPKEYCSVLKSGGEIFKTRRLAWIILIVSRMSYTDNTSYSAVIVKAYSTFCPSRPILYIWLGPFPFYYEKKLKKQKYNQLYNKKIVLHTCTRNTVRANA